MEYGTNNADGLQLEDVIGGFVDVSTRTRLSSFCFAGDKGLDRIFGHENMLMFE